MTRAAASLGLAILFLAPVAAQQTALTEAQLKSADAEVPRLIELLQLKPGMTVADVGAGFGAWTMKPAGVPANRLGHGVPPDVVVSEVSAALTHVRTIPAWAPDSEPAMLFLVLFRKP